MQFTSLAPRAVWRAGVVPSTSSPSAVPIQLQALAYGAPSSTNALGRVETALLEDDTQQSVIRMRTGDAALSTVRATFEVPQTWGDSVFRASVGFTRAARVASPPGDGARFEVWATLADGTEVPLFFADKPVDGRLRAIEVDVGPLVSAGALTLTLAVSSGASARADDAVWFAPRLDSVREGVVTRARLDVESFRTSNDDDEGGSAEPYLYARVLVIDGHGVRLDALQGATVRLLDATAGPDAFTPSPSSASLHDNLPTIASGQRRTIAPSIGRFRVAVRSIAPMPGVIDKALQVAALRRNTRVALLLVLMEEDDGPSDGAVRDVVLRAERSLVNALNADLRGALLHWSQPRPAGTPRPSIEECLAGFYAELEGRLADYCNRSIRNAIRDEASWPVNPDDHHGTHVRVLTFEDLLRGGAIGTVLAPGLRGGYSILYRYGIEP